MKFAQLVMGPAGSGKSTYCLEIHKHLTQTNHLVKIVNLDPSVENMEYPNSIDIRNLINVVEVMEEFYLGPNGALLFCMEYLMDNLEWLEYEINKSFEDHFILDLPGQIELYSHNSLMKELSIYLNYKCNLNIVGLFIIDCQFITDIGKFFSGTITALTLMLSLDIPHYNILNKMDLLKNSPKKVIEKFFYPNSKILINELNMIINLKYKKLTLKISKLLEDFSMIHYIPLDISSPEKLACLFQLINQLFETD
nr:purine nucleotide-binding protein [Cryptomonas curvata]